MVRRSSNPHIPVDCHSVATLITSMWRWVPLYSSTVDDEDSMTTIVLDEVQHSYRSHGCLAHADVRLVL